MGTAESEDTLVLSHHELPADGVSGETLMAATAAVARLISKLGTTRGPMIENLEQKIANLPTELRSEGARGLPRADGPLSDAAVVVLEEAAMTVSSAIAGIWMNLPLRVRRVAAASTVRHLRGRPTTLEQLFNEGDLIAIAAKSDSELARLLILQPLDEDLEFMDDSRMDEWTRIKQRSDDAAVQLAEEMSFSEGLRLLLLADPNVYSMTGPGALQAFCKGTRSKSLIVR